MKAQLDLLVEALEELRQAHQSEWVARGPLGERSLTVLFGARKAAAEMLVAHSIKCGAHLGVTEVCRKHQGHSGACSTTASDRCPISAPQADGRVLTCIHEAGHPEALHCNATGEQWVPVPASGNGSIEVGAQPTPLGNGWVQLHEHLGRWELTIGLRHMHADQTRFAFDEYSDAQLAIVALQRAEVAE